MISDASQWTSSLLILQETSRFFLAPTERPEVVDYSPPSTRSKIKNQKNKSYPNLKNETKTLSQFVVFCRFHPHPINQHDVKFMEGHHRYLSRISHVAMPPKITAQHFRSNSLWSSCERFDRFEIYLSICHRLRDLGSW